MKAITEQQITDLATSLNIRHGVTFDFIVDWLRDNYTDYNKALDLLDLTSSEFADVVFNKLTLN